MMRACAWRPSAPSPANIPLVLATVSLLAPAAAGAQLSFTGEVRPRSEVRDPSGGGAVTQGFTSMRTRLAARFITQGGATAFVQLQDVRLFGEEAGTTSDYSADGFDLHQGWILLGEDDAGSSLKVGRQEVVFGEERLVGTSSWGPQGRSFDGARLRLHPHRRLRVDVLAAQTSESVAPARATDAFFWAAYATAQAGGAPSLDLWAMTQQERAQSGDTRQWTVGASQAGRGGPLSYRLEGSVQTGVRDGRDVSAHMVGARLAVEVEGGSLTLWYDHLSGTQAGGHAEGAFDTVFGTNHRYYGFADLFTNIPAHTSSRGLRDAAVKVALPEVRGWTSSADLHRFLVAEDAGLEDARLGDELDLTLARRLPSGVALTAGLSYVLRGGALGPVRGIRDDVVWGYLMLDLVF